jgi:2-haloacid dehalogenase
MVAAHASDLRAAAACGLRTAYVDRPLEFGPSQRGDVPSEGERRIWNKGAICSSQLSSQCLQSLHNT